MVSKFVIYSELYQLLFESSLEAFGSAYLLSWHPKTKVNTCTVSTSIDLHQLLSIVLITKQPFENVFLRTAVFPPRWVSTAIDGFLAAIYHFTTAAVIAGCALGAVSCLPPKIINTLAVPAFLLLSHSRIPLYNSYINSQCLWPHYVS